MMEKDPINRDGFDGRNEDDCVDKNKNNKNDNININDK